MVQNKKLCLLCSISQESYIMIFIHGTHVWNDNTSSSFFHFSKFWFFGLLGGKRAKNSPKWQKVCLLCSISQERYIIWSSFAVHKCKMIVSVGTFFYFFKILIFWVVRRVKGQKWPKMTKNCPLFFIFQEPYIISWFMVHICKRIISPGVFDIFSKL